MTNSQAIVWMSHDSANVLRIHADGITMRRIHLDANSRAGGIASSRGRQGFFAEICDNFENVTELLLTGPRTALSDFRHFVLDHRPQVDDMVVAYQAVDLPDEDRLIRIAKRRLAEQGQGNAFADAATRQNALLHSVSPAAAEPAAAS